MSAASQMLDTLRAWGVPHVFCCPGTSEIPLLDALAEPEYSDRDPRFVLTTHEAISVSRADGYARASGGIGVAYLHTNVGLANGLAHLYAAQVARSSVAVIVGVKGTATLPHRALTTSPRLLDTAAPYVGHAWLNLRADALVDDVDRALWRSTVVPEQPSILAVPQDHLAAADATGTSAGRRMPARQRPSAESVVCAVETIRASRRPVIVAGSDVARRRATAALESIAERIGAPLYAESRRDLERWPLRTSHPHHCGLFDPRTPAVAESDLVILAGMPTPLEFSAEVAILPHGVPVLHITEDAAEAGRRYAPAAALVGDTAAALADLAATLDAATRDVVDSAPQREHLAQARAEHESRLAGWRRDVPADAEGGAFDAAVAMRVLADSLGTEGVLVLDGVTSTLPLLRFLERDDDDSLFATASGSLGWGMGAAAGVALARAERTIAVVGDGVLQFGVPALWTAARHCIPVTYLVVNNGRYQAVISGLMKSGGAASRTGEYPLTDISGLDIGGLARSFGIPSETVTGAAGLRAAVAAELGRTAQDGPRLIEVRVSDALWQ
ncbi:thiamine pyrophosphate-binding protein [Microbacterium sp.]|uniref:thiamine pyrophosphate-binding protein n=1 Tax=Microbacterium sp. TaxID=51671 RepID=UPI002811B951|nr:thiamine pyrophosphate-binding protein [Microbacterium sp.]